jgi:hypothetical protein
VIVEDAMSKNSPPAAAQPQPPNPAPDISTTVPTPGSDVASVVDGAPPVEPASSGPETETRPALKRVKIPPDGPGRVERIGVVTKREELPGERGTTDIVLTVRVTEPGVLAGTTVRVQESFAEYV